LLPPLLYPAALFTSWRDFRANLRAISLLAVGLVLCTTAVSVEGDDSAGAIGMVNCPLCGVAMEGGVVVAHHSIRWAERHRKGAFVFTDAETLTPGSVWRLALRLCEWVRMERF
jgi:hypothetical protein